MWKVVAKSDDGGIVWQSWDFEAEEEAEEYRKSTIERGSDVTNYGEQLTLWIERC